MQTGEICDNLGRTLLKMTEVDSDPLVDVYPLDRVSPSHCS